MQAQFFLKYLSTAPVLATITLVAIAVVLSVIMYGLPGTVFFPFSPPA